MERAHAQPAPGTANKALVPDAKARSGGKPAGSAAIARPYGSQGWSANVDLAASQVLQLQRTLGNRAVDRLIRDAQPPGELPARPAPSSGAPANPASAGRTAATPTHVPRSAVASRSRSGQAVKAEGPVSAAPTQTEAIASGDEAGTAMPTRGAGPLGFLTTLAVTPASKFGAALTSATAAGTAALEATRKDSELPACPAPSGLPAGAAIAPPPAPPMPSPVLQVPTAAHSGTADSLSLEPAADTDTDTDPALADHWAAEGAAAIDHAGSGVVDAPAPLAGRLKPVGTEDALPAVQVTPAPWPQAAPGPAPGPETAGPLDITMGPAIQALARTALTPATAAGDVHARDSSDAKAAAQAGVARLQTETTSRQRAAGAQADRHIAGLHATLEEDRSGIVANHKAAIANESGQAHNEVARTITETNETAKAKADEAETAQPEGERKSTGWWDRIKSAGRAAANAVAGIASTVLSIVRGIVASARQKITGIIKQLADSIKRRLDAALQAITAAVKRFGAAIGAAIEKAQDVVASLARAAAAMARKLWEAARARLAAAWNRLASAVSVAIAGAKAIVAKIAAGAAKLAEILKLLASGMLGRLFDAARDSDKLAAPIIAKATPFAGQVPGKAQQLAADKGGEAVQAAGRAAAPPVGNLRIHRQPAQPAAPITLGSVVDQAKPITGDEASQLLLEGHIREKESPVPAAPPGETFWGGVGRHLAAAGSHFLENWMTTLRNIVYAALTFYPVLLQEGPLLWAECKAVVGAGDGAKDPLDKFDHVLGVLRHLMNMVAGLIATSCLWALIIGAFTGPGEAVVYAACESVGVGLLIADATLTLIEMTKAAYGATRPGVGAGAREAYLSRFVGGGISAAIMLVLVVIAFFAKSLAEKFKPKSAAVLDAGEGDARKGGGKPEQPSIDEGGSKPTRANATLTPDEVKAGVRMARDIPGGGRLKLLQDGSLVVCHSPCQFVATRFRVELNLPDPDAVALKSRLAALTEEERAAVRAGDAAREEAAFNAADNINRELEAVRLRRLNALTGVDPATLATLIDLAADDGELVQKLLRAANNDPAKVRPLLDLAAKDVNVLARLSKAVDDFPRAPTPAGGAVSDARFAPFAKDADMKHFLERHSMEHFDFNGIKGSNSFYPKGTLASRIQEGIVEVLDIMRRNGDAFPENTKRIYPLRDGVVVQIVRDGGTIVQFFPLDGPGVVAFTREEMTAIGRLLGRLP